MPMPRFEILEKSNGVFLGEKRAYETMKCRGMFFYWSNCLSSEAYFNLVNFPKEKSYRTTGYKKKNHILMKNRHFFFHITKNQ